MRRLAISDPEIMRLALQQEIARSGESRYDHGYTASCWSARASVATRSPTGWASRPGRSYRATSRPRVWSTRPNSKCHL
jgi:hypothetical protein